MSKLPGDQQDPSDARGVQRETRAVAVGPLDLRIAAKPFDKRPAPKVWTEYCASMDPCQGARLPVSLVCRLGFSASSLTTKVTPRMSLS